MGRNGLKTLQNRKSFEYDEIAYKSQKGVKISYKKLSAQKKDSISSKENCLINEKDRIKNLNLAIKGFEMCL